MLFAASEKGMGMLEFAVFVGLLGLIAVAVIAIAGPMFKLGSYSVGTINSELP